MSSNWPQVREILNAALDLPPEKRRAHVEQACGDDAALLESVLSLLSDDSIPAGFLQPPIEGAAVQLVANGAEHAPAIEHIGQYRVTGVIDSGGIGTVYRAVPSDDENAPPVAVKVLKRGMTGEDMQRRFVLEQQVLARLKHRNIARFIDGGVTDAGLPYLVMEYIEGQPIDRYCDGQRLPVNQRLELFEDMCSAVQYSHRNLVVHRDLKPRNILVTDDGVPKLLDFGIAKLLEDGSSGPAADPTVTANRMITPQYASPEQISGAPISTATDVYSLGVVLYELLTGHRPYDLRGKARGEILQLIGEADPTSPSTQVMQTEDVTHLDGTTTVITPELISQARGTDAQSLRRELTGDLDTIVLTAMHKDPDRRYASVERLAEDLRRYRTGLPILARADTFSYRARKFIRRNKAATIAATIAFISLLAGTTGLAVGLQHSQDARERISEVATKAQTEAAKARSANKFLNELLSSATPLSNRQDLSVKALLDLAAERLEQSLANQPEVEAAVHRTVGNAYLQLDVFDRAAFHLNSALVLREKHGGEMDYAESLSDLGFLQHRLGNLDLAEETHRRAIKLLRSVHLDRELLLAEGLNDLALTLKTRGNYEEAEGLYREAIDIFHRHIEDSRLEYPVGLSNLARLKIELGQYGEALDCYASALEFVTEQLSETHPVRAIILKGYGDLFQQTGDSPAAEESFREVLSILDRLQNPPLTLRASVLASLGSLLKNRGEYESAQKNLQAALDIRREVFGDAHPDVGDSVARLGTLYSKTGDLSAAETATTEALRIYRLAYGEGHHKVGNLQFNLGNVYLRMNKLKLAEEHCSLALDIWTDQLGNGHRKVGRAYTTLGNILMLREDARGAEVLYRDGLRIRRKTLPEGHRDIATSLRLLGVSLTRQSKAAEALPVLREMVEISRNGPGEHHWRTALGESSLATCLIKLENFEVAEPLLLHSYPILSRVKGVHAKATKATAKSLVALYESWNKPEKAAEYRALLEEATGGDQSEKEEEEPPAQPEQAEQSDTTTDDDSE